MKHRLYSVKSAPMAGSPSAPAVAAAANLPVDQGNAAPSLDAGRFDARRRGSYNGSSYLSRSRRSASGMFRIS